MVTTVTDEWTEDMCIRLIREYRARPILWDPKNPFFFKKSVKPDAWREIGAALNVSPDACKGKMVVLLSSFRREKSKIMHSIREGKAETADSYRSTWFGFKEMAFLMDKESERKRQLTGIEEDLEVPSLKKTLLSHHIEKPTHFREVKSTVPRASRKDRANINIPAEQSNMKLQTSVASEEVGPIVEENEEEIKSFTNFIATKMKKYSETTKNAVQRAICEIIFKADQNYYETSFQPSQSSYQEETEEPLNEHLQIDTEGNITIKHEISDSDYD